MSGGSLGGNTRLTTQGGFASNNPGAASSNALK